MSFTLESHKDDAISAKNAAVVKGLHMIGLQAERYAKEELTRQGAVDTGRLRASVLNAIEGDDSVVIGTNVEYAPYIEFGTSKMAARPYLRPAAQNHSDEYKQMILACLQGAL